MPTVTTRASSLISIASAMVAMTIEKKRALGLEEKMEEDGELGSSSGDDFDQSGDSMMGPTR